MFIIIIILFIIIIIILNTSKSSVSGSFQFFHCHLKERHCLLTSFSSVMTQHKVFVAANFKSMDFTSCALTGSHWLPQFGEVW